MNEVGELPAIWKCDNCLTDKDWDKLDKDLIKLVNALSKKHTLD